MRIFVSYSSRNRPQVKALVQDLENTGHDVWYDQEAAGGHEWWADILENIRACELFIFALTPESLDSEACRREYRYAHALHKRILPVRLNKVVNPASLPVELQKINFVDYFSGADQEYRQLVRAITSLKPPVPMPEPMPDEPPVPISPLGELREKIAARSIGVETQTYLVFELKQHVEKAATRAEALALLQRLQNHPDMRVGVANEIKTIITPYMPHKLPETPRKSSQPLVSPRLMAGGLVGLVAIAVVIVMAILLSGGDEGDKQNPTDGGDRTEVALDLTDTPTHTPSPTNEASATNTVIATPSPTDEPTYTPTVRSTDTPTATPTVTATNTLSPTSTPTPTATATLPLGSVPVTSNAQWKEMGGPIEREFDGVMMVLVPVGCFDMGSEEGYIDERPVVEQCFDEPFWIDKYEVTNAQYGSSWFFTDPNQPRVGLDWKDANSYCLQRGARLPTEREWEYSGRGPSSYLYPWGNLFEPDAVVYKQNANEVAIVGSKPHNISWVGAMDMIGNVWEWTSTIYAYYPYSVNTHENSQDFISTRARRGGSYLSEESYLNLSNRASEKWNRGSYSDIGFRCARDYNGELEEPTR